jgi:isoquinoline 1-oxidoreductase beta subunit
LGVIAALGGASIPHAFAIQSFVAELAHAAGRDPKDYLLAPIGPARIIDPTAIGDVWNHGEDPKRYPIDTGRLRRVIETAADGIKWGRSLPKSSGLGIAGHYSFVSYVAVAAEVQVEAGGRLVIPRGDIAIDCGPRVNLDRVRSQMEGAVVMGVGLATTAEVSFKNGRVQENNFDGYEVTRIDSAPREIRVHVLSANDYNQPLGGVGEPGVPPVAPALANAVSRPPGSASEPCRSAISLHPDRALVAAGGSGTPAMPAIDEGDAGSTVPDDTLRKHAAG